MRNLFATTAILAAMVVAAPAMAQNISVQNNQTNTGTVGATINVRDITASSDLKVDGLAVGNVLQVNANPNSQGIAEAASNNGGTVSPQNNSGNISSNVNFGSAVTAATSTLNASAVGNLANLNGVAVVNSGNRVLGQANTGNVDATLTLQGGSYNAGVLKANALAAGNNLSATGTGTVQLGAGQNGGGVLVQSNSGAQTAVTNFVFGGDSASVASTTTAVGNSLSASAPTVGVTISQNNSGAGQTALVNFNQGTQTANVSSSALGNVVAPSGGSFSSAGGVVQVNNAQQTATTNFQNVGVFNGGATVGGATAVGNVIQLNQTGAISLAGSQSNGGVVTSNVNVSGGGYTGTSAFSSQAMGNLIAATSTTGGFGSGAPQSNFGNVSANGSITGGGFTGATSMAVLGAGNILQVQGGGAVEGINGAANQLNAANVTSLANVTGGSFGALNVSATSIGNLTSVKTGN